MLNNLKNLRLLIASGLLLGGLPIASASAADRKPNVILISAKEFAGARATATPNIDLLAAGGAKLTNGYSAASLAGPANAGLLTGRYPQRFGFDANAEVDLAATDHVPRGLDPAQVTLAQRLKNAGYITGAFGDWYLGSTDGYLPTQRGFDEFYGTLSPVNREAVYRGNTRDETVDNPLVHFERYESEALSFIDHHADAPFFAYLPVTGKSGQLDDLVGQLVGRLHDRHLDTNTLVIFLNDHTEQWHLKDDALRSEIIFNLPGVIPAGQVVSDPITQIDIAPTVLTTAGVQISPDLHLDGNSLLPLLNQTATVPVNETLYWRFGAQSAIRDGEWKLVKISATATPKLFHLTEDPGEKTDRIKDQPDIAKSLQDAWDAWNKGNEQPRWVDDHWNSRSGEDEGVSEKPVRSANAQGPWNSGDSLPGRQAPDVAGKAIEISADLDVTGNQGVVVSQGGVNHGFAIFLSNGKLAFAVRESTELTTITAKDSLATGHYSVQAKIGKDGALALLVNGKEVASGKADGPIPQQPRAGLSIGDAEFGPVGDYESPNPFGGKVSNVRIETPPIQ